MIRQLLTCNFGERNCKSMLYCLFEIIPVHYNHRYNSEHNTKAKEFLLSQLKPRFSETNSPSRIKSKPVTVIIMDIILGSLCV